MGDMSRNDVEELVLGLRRAASFFEGLDDEAIELLPYITFSEYIGVTIQNYDTEKSEYVVDEYKTRTRVRGLARLFGKASKDFYGNTFSLEKSFSDRVRITVTANRSTICRKVVKEVVHRPAEFVPAHTKPARDEEVVEWVCDDPLLRTRDDEVATA